MKCWWHLGKVSNKPKICNFPYKGGINFRNLLNGVKFVSLPAIILATTPTLTMERQPRPTRQITVKPRWWWWWWWWWYDDLIMQPHITYSLLLDDVTQGDLDQRILPDQASPHNEKFVFIFYRGRLSVGITVHSRITGELTRWKLCWCWLRYQLFIFKINSHNILSIKSIIAFIVFNSRKETKPIGLVVTKCHKPFQLYWWFFNFKSEYGCDGNHQGRNPTLSIVKNREGEVSDHKKKL